LAPGRLALATHKNRRGRRDLFGKVITRKKTSSITDNPTPIRIDFHLAGIYAKTPMKPGFFDMKINKEKSCV
jgi:hypothetical protein